MTEVWLAFTAGLVGSIHCIGMCGGIVAAISLSSSRQTMRSRLLVHGLYNLGRVSTYAVLGVAAGFIGSALDLVAVKSVALWCFCAANLFVIAVGLASLFRCSWFSLTSLDRTAGSFLTRPFRYCASSSSSLAAFPLGLCLGFLPCGLVYGPLLTAATSGSPFSGGAIMVALGIGTMPALLAFGSASAAVSGILRERMFRLLGLIIALMGTAGLWRLLGKMGYMAAFPFR